MHWIDLSIFIIYLLAMLGVGVYFFYRNRSDDDYYVGGRNMSAGHIGLSVVATDVGGGFSIGLGGLGFTMGLSGNWMLFTGLIGAWMSSVWLIPKIFGTARKKGLLSFPQALEHFYNPKVALIAGIISFIGYIGFTSSQILAGAKLASATFPTLDIAQVVWIMGVVAVVYTVIGGIKAVIYTDSVQWSILLLGLVGIGIPLGFLKIGGFEGLRNILKPEMLELTNISIVQLINWAITIIPIWFVGMTLYQRIYACKDEKTAIKAWRIAGLFEWPVMAFMGVLLGLFAKVGLEQGMFVNLGYDANSTIDAEMGLPLFLRETLPIGLMGLMLSAYFSAIMSTADSCLMAASGNLTSDVLGRFKFSKKSQIGNSQIATLIIGAFAVFLALEMKNVLELMLYSYAFMVSGLLVPVLGMLFLSRPSVNAAITAMITGGGTTLSLILLNTNLPLGLDPNFFGILISALSFTIVQKFDQTNKPENGIFNAGSK
ncbi:MAG: sodium:solute symporter family protein [Vicingaceae bacterium]